MAVRIKNKKRFVIANMTLLLIILFIVKVTVYAAKTIGKLVNKKSKYAVSVNYDRSKNGNIKIDENENFIRFVVKLKDAENFIDSEQTNKEIKLTIDRTDKLLINSSSDKVLDKYLKFSKDISGNKLIIKKINSENNFVYKHFDDNNIVILISKNNNPFKDEIVLDAGHGGKDPGTKASDQSFVEKDKTLEICKKLEEKLVYQGCKVVMTRNQDDFLSLDDRVKISKESDAKAFVSIHIDSDEASTAYKGITVHYYYKNNLTEKARVLATDIDDNIGANDTWKNRGALYGNNYYVLKFNSKPSVLIECGFSSNSGDVKRLNDSKIVNNLVGYIEKGIMDYLER
ncbi:N-acetylmuramoyl-L-alanine amidase family protein [Clostridium oryzae]|uniref:N-acetylmuramoyl-L-alanine amidase LytC n=1 Tax=Clostridium oryzae TaxID=1450648 RepID=A0A1V4I3X3_9CLOT|nr:N-acetylmuramoyl-L-alanine amidase [Clostridium oryzae]OPJ54676.1 N-acetylmuramoyl-L-alanine amidase LytC precursor [Clostridium oryzae]